MIEKQLTIKDLIEKIGAQKCISCKGKVNISKAWKIPLCPKCMVEVSEDLEEEESQYI